MQLTTTANQTLPVAGLAKPYQYDVRLFNTWLNGRPINPTTLKAYFAELEETQRVGTLSRKKSALKKAIAQMRGNAMTLSEQAQLTEVFKSIKTGRSEPSIEEHEILSTEELNELIEYSGKKTSAIISALYDTAARVSELLSILIADCKTTGDYVRCLVRRGKGKKERTVYMQKNTFRSLRTLYGGKKFLIEHNGNEVSRFTVAKLVSRAGKRMGKPKIHAHTIRHTKASHLLRAGMSLPAVSAYCGHADPAVTAKFYLHDKPTPEAVLTLKPR